MSLNHLNDIDIRVYIEFISANTSTSNQPLNNVDVNVHERFFNVDIWLKLKVKPTYVYRRSFNDEMRSFLR